MCTWLAEDGRTSKLVATWQTFLISTLLTETPATDANDVTPATKAVCQSELNFAAESGSDTTTSTNLVQGLGVGVSSLGFSIWGSGFRV